MAVYDSIVGMAQDLSPRCMPVDIMAPLVAVPGQALSVLSTDEILAIDTARLKLPVGMPSRADRARIKPAADKVIGEYRFRLDGCRKIDT